MLGVSVGGQGARAARTERAVPFAAGERLEYDVSWSSYVSAGTVVLNVAEKRPSFSSVAYYIVAEAKPSSLLSSLYTLYYKADTLLDAYSLLPQRGSVFSREGRRQRMKITSFDHGAKKARFDMQTASKMSIDMTITPATQDFVSAIYALRAGALKPGDRLRMTVADSGHLYQAEFAVAAAEPFKLGANQVPALRIVPAIVDDKGEAGRERVDAVGHQRRPPRAASPRGAAGGGPVRSLAPANAGSVECKQCRISSSPAAHSAPGSSSAPASIRLTPS